MQFESLDSSIAEGFMKIMNPEFKGRVRVVEARHEKKGLLMLTRDRWFLMIYVNDAQGRPIDMDDVLKFEW